MLGSGVCAQSKMLSLSLSKWLSPPRAHRPHPLLHQIYPSSFSWLLHVVFYVDVWSPSLWRWNSSVVHLLSVRQLLINTGSIKLCMGGNPRGAPQRVASLGQNGLNTVCDSVGALGWLHARYSTILEMFVDHVWSLLLLGHVEVVGNRWVASWIRYSSLQIRTDKSLDRRVARINECWSVLAVDSHLRRCCERLVVEVWLVGTHIVSSPFKSISLTATRDWCC